MELLSLMYSWKFMKHMHALNQSFGFNNMIHISVFVLLFSVSAMFIAIYFAERNLPNVQHKVKKIKHFKSKLHFCQFCTLIFGLCFLFTLSGNYNGESLSISNDYYTAKQYHKVHEDNVKLPIYNHKYNHYKKLNQNNTKIKNLTTKYHHKYNITYSKEHEHIFEGYSGRQDMPDYRPSDIQTAKEAGKMTRIPHNLSFEFTSHHVI